MLNQFCVRYVQKMKVYVAYKTEINVVLCELPASRVLYLTPDIKVPGLRMRKPVCGIETRTPGRGATLNSALP